MAVEPSCRVKAHAEGISSLCYDSKKCLVTCGGDKEVITYLCLADEDLEPVQEFDIVTDHVSAMVCYRNQEGEEVVAMAMDNNTVQAFSIAHGTADGLLMRFTSSVTSLAVTRDHTHLAAGSSEFTIKVLELHHLPAGFSLVDHEAPVLCVTFDPRGELLASSSCDGTVRVWSIPGKECIHVLHVLPKCSDVSLSPSLSQLAWNQAGDLLAIPVGSEIKVYQRSSWKCVFTLSDAHYHTEPLNVVRWSSCDAFLACGDNAGRLSVWQVSAKTLILKMRNENETGITGLEWDPRGRGTPNGSQLVFADSAGYVGVFRDVYPSSQDVTNRGSDPLAEDSLLMEGIPEDDIFGDDFDALVKEGGFDDCDGMGVTSDVGVARGHGGGGEELEGGGTLRDDLSDLAPGSDLEEDVGGHGLLVARPPRQGPKFSEKLIEDYQTPWQPSATPTHLQHRFMVYNLVGMVGCDGNEEAPLIEVTFHNSATHHAFSLPNPHTHSMAALSEQALVLASHRTEDQPSQLQCVHFGSWDLHKDWTIPLPSKESISAVATGNGWVAIATNKRLLRLFTVGGVQREVVSVPGHVTTLAAWGPRLAVVYQVPPCSSSVYSLTVWVLDVQRKRQLHPPHTLPLSHHARLLWIGFSEEGCLITHDSKGILRIHGNSCYGGLSWIPVLDTNKKLGNKNDHYFIVGMTHEPDELRGILCKDLEYPPVHPRPVMSSLPLQMPLCEPQLERTEHERAYLEAAMVTLPTRSRTPAELVQKLMKMFAFSCKSGREYKACEIAAMMPDQQSMDLAMTYASRSQHLQLARHISELCQQKYSGGSDPEPSDGEEEGEAEWTNRNGHSNEEELSYARERTISLRQGLSRFPPPSALTNGPRALGGSKFSRYKDAMKKGKRIRSAGSHAHSTGARSHVEAPPLRDEAPPLSEADETSELFSDSEEITEEDRTAESAVAGEESDDHESSPEGGEGQDEGEGVMQSPKAFGDTSIRKRANPFKLTTPVSKRISAERRTGFLDNITARADEDKRAKDARQQRGRGKNVGRATGGRGGANRKPTSSAQKSLKKSFFKKKEVSGQAAPPPTDNGNSQPNDVHSLSHDQHMTVPLSPSCDPIPGSCESIPGSREPSPGSHEAIRGPSPGSHEAIRGPSPGSHEASPGSRGPSPGSRETMEEGIEGGAGKAEVEGERLTSAEKLASFAFKSQTC